MREAFIVMGAGIEEETKYASVLSCDGRYNPIFPQDRELKLKYLRGFTEDLARYIGNTSSDSAQSCKNEKSPRLTRSFLSRILSTMTDAIKYLRGKNATHITNLGMPPRHLWNLPILSDAAIYDSSGEELIFVEATALDPTAFNRRCVFDINHGMYRIFIQASSPYSKGS